jgi:multicomponent Na+:H+ antiporter subunit D
MTSPAPWAVCVPLAGAVLALFFGRSAARWIGLTAGSASLALAALVAWRVWESGPFRHPVGGWGAPLGIDLHADGLAALMLLMTAGVGLFTSIYASAYFTHGGSGAWRSADGFWPLWLFLQGALSALFLSADVFNLYVSLELLTLAAIGLVVIAGERAATAAAMQYLLAAFMGSMVYLLGVALLYASFDSLDIATLASRVVPGTAASAALALITVGLLLKTALFPLHFWLPAAHGNAPAPVSAILSALVVKASFYMLIRLWVQVFPAAMSFPRDR